MEKKDEEINLDTKNLKRIVINSINNIIKKSMEGGDYSTDKESNLMFLKKLLMKASNQ